MATGRQIALIAAATLAVATLSGCSGQQSSPAAASPSSRLGGIVRFQSDGAPATTEINVVANGTSVSGTAVTKFGNGTHTVRLGCATRSGDTWALGGKTEQTTVPGERAGDWSAVIVKDGSPQRIGIWLSDDPSTASDCKAWLVKIEIATIGAENFNPVESGTLVPPA